MIHGSERSLQLSLAACCAFAVIATGCATSFVVPSVRETGRGSMALRVTPIPAAPAVQQTMDRPPVYEGFQMSPLSEWAPGRTVSLAVKAFDPGGKSVAFAWSVDGGRIGYAGGEATTWQLPVEPGAYQIAVTIINGSIRFTKVTQALTIHHDGTLTVTPRPLVEHGTASIDSWDGPVVAEGAPTVGARRPGPNVPPVDRLAWQPGART